jgi:ubiquinone/menaquinone biosynthesis C-methylase UbiE
VAPDHDDARVASQRQFGRQAARYAASLIHSKGESLRLVDEMAAVQPGEAALDVGTGAGFTAFALAEDGGRTVATDIAPGMLSQARRLAVERRLKGISFALAGAEALAFTDGAFDVVTCRLAAHHFIDVRAAVAEFYRVLRPGGRLVICDTLAPEDEAIADYQHDLERRRDATHVRDYSPSRWREMLSQPGFQVTRSEALPGLQEFSEWVGRAGTPDHLTPGLRRSLAEAPPAVRREFAIRSEGDIIRWHWMHGVFLAGKP